jgi:hypothetical protein
MKQAELTELLKASHVELLQAIQGLTEAELAQPGAAGDWSAKDILAHVTAWEAEILKALGQSRMGKRPTINDLTDAEVDVQNAQWQKQTLKKPLAKVMEDLNGVRQQIIRQVERMSDADLNDPARHRSWLEGHTLAEFIASESFEHGREHAEQIRAWRNRSGD